MRAVRGRSELLVGVWADPDAASAALAELRAARKQHVIGILQAATLVAGADGKLHIADTKDMSATRGALIGAMLGAGLGRLRGGVRWWLLGGGAIGAAATWAHDGGLPDDWLEALGRRLAPSSSAIVALVEVPRVADVERELAAVGADILREVVEQELLDRRGVGP